MNTRGVAKIAEVGYVFIAVVAVGVGNEECTFVAVGIVLSALPVSTLVSAFGV